MTPIASSPRSSHAHLAVALVLAVVGIGATAELTRIHVETHTNPSFRSFCAVSETVNCETVAQSPYSVFAGLPVSVWGLLGYLAIVVLAGWGLTRRRLHDAWPHGLLMLLALGAASVSGIMGWISATRIDSLCLFCLGTYVLNGLLLANSATWLWRAGHSPGRALLGDLRALIARPLLGGGLVVLAGALVVGLELGVPAYWLHARWGDLPALPQGVDKHGHHWIGATDPVVTILEFSDYQCPHCRRAHKELRQVLGRYAGSVRLLHRHLPLDQDCNEDVKKPFHEHACRFSRAVECAGEQGRFWDMNDAIFSGQETAKAEDIDVEILAVQMGLDRSVFVECLGAPRIAERIAADLAQARKLAVAGTPTFYLGGRPFPGELPASEIDRVLERAARKSE